MRWGKRLLDLSLIVLFAPIVLPIVAIIAAVIWIFSGNPFYSQLRVGQDQRIFRMWKFRSMVIDADAKLEEHFKAYPEARREWDQHQKLRNDPRITRFGRILRKTSLDELPQLLNVVTGDMSLVGPRPMLPEQKSMYPGTEYYSLRPGMTGLWQVSERNSCSFSKRAHFDSLYAGSLSLITDVIVLVRTIKVVLRGTGI